MNSSERFRFGLYEVDLKAWELRKQGLKIKLQAQPFGVLAMLLERPGEIISREELRQKLWPADVFVDFDQALNKAVNKLRDALGDAAENPRFIETVPKRGYRFIAPIMKVRDGQDAAASSPSPGRGKWKYRTTAVASVMVLAIATCIAWIWARRSNTVYPLAVLPLSNSSSDANLDYLGDGITESIINNLSQLERLKVMARSTVFHYKGKPTDPRTIGRELGVRAVLTGRVYQLGDKVMVDTELIDVADGSRLWAHSTTANSPTSLLFRKTLRCRSRPHSR